MYLPIVARPRVTNFHTLSQNRVNMLTLPDELLLLVASFWPSVVLLCRATRNAVLASMGTVRPMKPLDIYMSEIRPQPRLYAGRQCFLVCAATTTTPLVLVRARKVCRCKQATQPCSCSDVDIFTYERIYRWRGLADADLTTAGSVLCTERLPLAFFPAILPPDAAIVRIFSSLTSAYTHTGPHVVVYTTNGAERIVVLSTRGVFFIGMHPGSGPRTEGTWEVGTEFNNVWWYKGMLCALNYHNYGTNLESRDHVIQVWSFRERAVVKCIVGKRVWAKFRGRSHGEMHYPIKVYPGHYYHAPDIRIRALAPDGKYRFAVVTDRRVLVWDN